MLTLFSSGASRGARKGYNKLAGEESEVNNVNCTAPQCVVQESSGPGPGGPDSSDTGSNCSDLELEEELSDDSDYGESAARRCSALAVLTPPCFHFIGF
jgi:hypothetical protein